jgi:pilus assembly protein CpaB
MKPKTIILMVVAVACGLAASYMTSQLLAERNTAPEPEVQEKVKILVARNNLELGLLIKDPRQHFKEKLFLKGEEPAKALTDKDFDQLKERRLVKPLKADEFVTVEDLIDKNQNVLSARLPKGMRAVGIWVDARAIAAGFASLPMSHVDIISTIRGGDGDALAQVLLENVLVLAADQATQRPDGQNAMPASIVTVALSPADAELITLAQDIGSLKLVLRGYGDTKPTKTEGVKGSTIADGSFRDRDKNAKKAKDDSASDDSPSALIKKVLDIKDDKKDDDKKATVAAAPKTTTHVLTIYNGDQGRRYPYKLNEKGKVVEEDITEADPDPAATTKPAPRAEEKKPEEKKPEEKKPEVKKPEEPQPAEPAPRRGLRRR